MNAGRILRRAGYDTEALRVRIAPVDPDTVNVWPASRFFQRFWRSGIQATTHGRLIFVAPELMAGDPKTLGRLVVHELIHVRQYLAAGYFRFLISYLKEYVMGRVGGLTPRDAYLNVPHEREARDLTEQTVI